ncbi:TetR/AcrR family transcriptional regulator [Iamia sp.]|uniref:TetR/AcrR family transcriptional regulator n=1 Tax=Iamia sp. TaxID=2722710 RepID=UPI002C8BD837|nr:TetR/AcrR family transcriptional regulator [Iamia sp.]HXH55971.1 TetR/AcrR family transcriptional regulator [Iamia sp.]
MTASTLPPPLRPRKDPRQRRSAETRARILVAARAVFEEHGYSHGTTNRIAAAARLSVGSLYQYFPNKDAILVELVDAHIDAGAAVLEAALADAIGDRANPPPLSELIAATVGALVGLHATDRQLHRVLFEEAPRPPEQLARLRALEAELTGRVAALLAGHPEVRVADPTVAARLVIDTVESLVHRVATDDASGIADDVLTAEITRMVVAYLRTD